MGTGHQSRVCCNAQQIPAGCRCSAVNDLSDHKCERRKSRSKMSGIFLPFIFQKFVIICMRRLKPRPLKSPCECKRQKQPIISAWGVSDRPVRCYTVPYKEAADRVLLAQWWITERRKPVCLIVTVCLCFAQRVVLFLMLCVGESKCKQVGD